MFWLGSGPIRGFAVTLTIGIMHVDLRVRHRRAAADLLLAELEQAQVHARHSSCRSRRSATMRLHPQFQRLRFLPARPAAAVHALQGLCLGAVDRRAWRCSLAVFIDVAASTTASTSRAARCIEVQSTSGPADIADLREKLGKLGVGAVQIQSFGAPHRRADPRRAAARRRTASSRRRSRRCTDALGETVHAAPRRGGGPGGVERAAHDRLHRRRRRPAGDRGLRLVPLRMAVRASAPSSR